MLVDGIALGLDVIISFQEILIVEPEVLLLFSGHHQLVLGVPEFGLSLEDLRVQLSVSSILILSLSLQVRFMGKLAVEVSLKGLGLSHESRVVVLASGEFCVRRVQSFISSSQLKLLGVGQLVELI